MKYRTRVIADLAAIGAEAWDALVRADAARRSIEANPFLRYDFLAALHETGCADAASGWDVEYLAVWQGERLVGAMPMYRKAHSYGEYVFDWAWADAYRRNDLDYYPKLLSAIPFTPVTGPRAIAVDAAAGGAVVAAAMVHARASDVSSLHVLFPEGDDEADALERAGCMRRDGVQFHWTNQGYADFDAFVDTLERKKRKNVRAERRKVAEAGVRVRRIEGRDATDADWRFFARCYANTYRAHYSTPYLNLAFFRRIAASMPEHLLLVIAERERGGDVDGAVEPVASSLVVFTDGTLYGRYWGEVEHVPCLHFECAYYQPLEFCIERGIRLFEGGAQGEHKMARGFLPVKTRSLHWLAHPAFADAVEHFLARETIGIGHYVDELNDRDPFKRDGLFRDAFAMSSAHVLLALAIALVWGVNFVVMKVALVTLPPFFFAFLRFACAALPLVFFYRPPAVPWRLLAWYAGTQFACQYAFLFVGLGLGMPAGLSSAVIQLQAFFTIALAAPMLGARPRSAQWIASAIALSGMAVIAWHVEDRATMTGLFLVVAAALSWGFGNIWTKRIAIAVERAGVPVDTMAIVAWASLVAALPLLALSLVLEGPAAIVAGIARSDWRAAGAVLFNGYVVTTFGFGAWTLLMRRYPPATVAPFALLVPIAGMGSAALLLGETLHGWAIAAATLVILGLAINQYAGLATAAASATPRSS